MKGVQYFEGMHLTYVFKAWKWHVHGMSRVRRWVALVNVEAGNPYTSPRWHPAPFLGWMYPAFLLAASQGVTTVQFSAQPQPFCPCFVSKTTT